MRNAKKSQNKQEGNRRHRRKKTDPTCSYAVCWYQNAQIPTTGNGHASTHIGISTHTGTFLGSITITVQNYRVPICAITSSSNALKKGGTILVLA
jgi:hypothetical protein